MKGLRKGRSRVLIDALHIVGGGGRVLLDYFLHECYKNNWTNFDLLVDDRNESDYGHLTEGKVFSSSSSYLNRIWFYLKRRSNYDVVFCFANFAPPIPLATGARVYTYFHQPLLIKLFGNFTYFDRIKYGVKKIIFNITKKNSSNFMVQSNLIADGLRSEYGLDNVWVLPFYENLSCLLDHSVERDGNSFIYVSSGAGHKNHFRLLEAFKHFWIKNRIGSLYVTISDNYQDILDYIEDMQKSGIPVYNIGVVSRVTLAHYYSKCEYLVFPSLTESFGLGLVEAIDCGCKVIASERAYVGEMIVPSLSFDPLDVNSISQAFELACTTSLPKSEKIVLNQLDKLLNILGYVND